VNVTNSQNNEQMPPGVPLPLHTIYKHRASRILPRTLVGVDSDFILTNVYRAPRRSHSEHLAIYQTHPPFQADRPQGLLGYRPFLLFFYNSPALCVILYNPHASAFVHTATLLLFICVYNSHASASMHANHTRLHVFIQPPRVARPTRMIHCCRRMFVCCLPTRGFHSSTSQLILSRVCLFGFDSPWYSCRGAPPSRKVIENEHSNRDRSMTHLQGECSYIHEEEAEELSRFNFGRVLVLKNTPASLGFVVVILSIPLGFGFGFFSIPARRRAWQEGH